MSKTLGRKLDPRIRELQEMAEKLPASSRLSILQEIQKLKHQDEHERWLNSAAPGS